MGYFKNEWRRVVLMRKKESKKLTPLSNEDLIQKCLTMFFRGDYADLVALTVDANMRREIDFQIAY